MQLQLKLGLKRENFLESTGKVWDAFVPMESQCLHELPSGQCSICKIPPNGINKTVYVTNGGLAFHNDFQCRTLLDGQQEAESKGLTVHPINPASWSDAFSNRKPCRNCCPDYVHPK